MYFVQQTWNRLLEKILICTVQTSCFISATLCAEKIDSKVCVVVDGFSTGRMLADGIKAYGYSCIHVQSSPHMEILAGKLDTHKYLENIHFNGSIDPILERLKSYEVKCVIPGADSGTLIADQLASALAVFPNVMDKTLARRNKYYMTKAVAEHGLPTVQFYKSTELQDILVWIKTVDSWPIVIKPLDSAGGDNVHFCHNVEEIAEAFQRVKSSINIFGDQNVEVLAQTYASGQEYMLNIVAHDGIAMITDIWKAVKNKAVYDRCEAIVPGDPEFAFLENYALEVCEALGINYGAAHIEVKLDPTQGPIFIECGARMMGSAELSLQTEMYGHNQLTLLLEAYFNPEFFKRRARERRKRALKYATTIDLISNKTAGVLRDANLEDYFRHIPSFHSMYFKLKTGDQLKETVDMLSSPGVIHLMNKDREQLFNDYLKVRELEKMMYEEITRDSGANNVQ